MLIFLYVALFTSSVADPVCHFDADTDPSCHFDTDSYLDPTFHFAVNFRIQILAFKTQNLEKVLN
jgi:hypothetical protein